MVRLPLSLLATLLCGVAAARAGVEIARDGGAFRITVGGEWFGDYRIENGRKPILYPLRAAGGVPLTCLAAENGANEDHPHHESFWYAHGDVNGHDFWRQIPGTGRAVVAEVLEAASGKESGVIRTRQNLVAADGRTVATDERTLRVFARTDCRMLDYEVTWIASHGPLHLGATKESAMALRVAESLRVDPAGGSLVNSEGHRNGEVARHRARWADYHGTIGGKTYGIALLDHPDNPLSPTWWLAREYGLLAASPFGGHELGDASVAKSELRLAAGERVTFRYRIILHEGDERAADIAGSFAEYAKSGAVPAAATVDPAAPVVAAQR